MIYSVVLLAGPGLYMNIFKHRGRNNLLTGRSPYLEFSEVGSQNKRAYMHYHGSSDADANFIIVASLRLPNASNHGLVGIGLVTLALCGAPFLQASLVSKRTVMTLMLSV